MSEKTSNISLKYYRKKKRQNQNGVPENIYLTTKYDSNAEKSKNDMYKVNLFSIYTNLNGFNTSIKKWTLK